MSDKFCNYKFEHRPRESLRQFLLNFSTRETYLEVERRSQDRKRLAAADPMETAEAQTQNVITRNQATHSRLQSLISKLSNCLCCGSEIARFDEASPSTSRPQAEPQHGCKTIQLSDSLFQLHAPTPASEINLDIFFFHGLQDEGSSEAHLSTWISGDSLREVWPQTWLPIKYPRARIISVTYDAAITTTDTEGRMDLHLIGEKLMFEILRARAKQGCPLILVGHSFGGLVLKQLCLHASRNKESQTNGHDMERFLVHVQGIFFYATPHRGMDGILDNNSVIRSVKANESLLNFVKVLSTDGARLHAAFERMCRHYDWNIHGLGESHAVGQNGSPLVPEASSRLGDNWFIIESDHYSICKPMSKTCMKYQHLVRLIDIIYAGNQGGGSKLQKLRDKVVGAESLLMEAQEHLQEHAFLGFWGMGGVGKTTMAKLLFETLCARGSFEYTGFVDEMLLVSGNFQQIRESIGANMHRYGHPIPTRLGGNDVDHEARGKKMLLVFDGIAEDRHIDLLQQIVESNGSEESRYIVTSRDQELLRQMDGIKICGVVPLELENAMALFKAHAFPEQEEPPDELKTRVEKVVQGCAGLPLTLEVVGKYLRVKDEKVWDDISEALRKADNIRPLQERVWAKLRLSFDGLGTEEQEMFLDVASFLLQEDCPFSFRDLRSAWSSMYQYVSIHWQTLLDRSLVQEQEYVPDYFTQDPYRLAISYLRRSFFFRSSHHKELGKYMKRVQMHEHLRGLGERITRERHIAPTLLGESHGLDSPGRIVALRRDVILSDLVGSSSDLSEDTARRQANTGRYLKTQVPPDFLPNGLRLLYWKASNSGVSPHLNATSFQTLVVLILKKSNEDCRWDILLSQMCKHMSRLERLVLESDDSSLPDALGDLNLLEHLEIRCAQLEKLIENFGSLSNLETLGLDDCQSLKALPKSLGTLHGLQLFRLWGCSKLETLPQSFGALSSLTSLTLYACESLKTLPHNFGNLSSLNSLDLRSCVGLQNLPESFGNLSSLNSLDLSSCVGLQKLPESFGNLSSLNSLHLSFCEGLQNLPERFGNLSSLNRLHLNFCEGLPNLPESFGNLSSLNSLGLYYCKGLQHLCQSFGNLSSLNRLDLRSCEGLQNLPESFGNLSSLNNLYLSSCEDLQHLPESFGNLFNLNSLDLSSCEGLQNLPESFGNLSKLKSLDLSSCEGLQNLPESFRNLSSLNNFHLSSCEDLQHLPESFENLFNLNSLDLSSCEGLQNLPESFGNLSSLNSLKLYYCKGLQDLPESFGNLSSLNRLDLSSCEGLQNLPESFGNLSNLKSLDLSSCEGLQNLPESFGNLSSLNSLHLSSCEGFQNLPESFGNLSNLKSLHLRFCKRLQNLPESFGNFSSLNSLDLSSCEGLQHLPESFGNLCSLNSLDLSACVGLQKLPESFGKLSSLNSLDLRSCEGFQNLPESFGNLSSLNTLHLSFCEGLQNLPESFGNLSSLNFFHLSFCEGLQHLSKSFGNLSSLNVLDLSFCEGLQNLPESFGNLSHLISLKLYYCKGLQNLPESLENLSKLKSLYLESCEGLKNLSESFGNLSNLNSLNLSFCVGLQNLPDSFGNLSSLNSLDLSFCKGLQNLPESFGNLSNLNSFKLYFCEGLQHLPESFGNLSSLNSLDLSFCRGLQNLPESFGNLSSLNSLNLYYCEGLQNLPESFGNLSNLEGLYLDHYSRLQNLPKTVRDLVQYLV